MQLFDIVELWMAWAEAALLLLLFIIHAAQPHTIALGIQAIATPIQRRYTDGGGNLFVYVLQALFQIGTMALTLLVTVGALLTNDHPIGITQLGMMMAIVAVVSLVRGLLNRYLHSAFKYPVHAPTYFGYQSLLRQVVCTILFFYLLFAPHLSTVTLWIIPCLVGVLYIAVVLWKLINLFGLGLDHVVYILLYILHLEILPILAMAAGAYQLISYTI